MSGVRGGAISVAGWDIGGAHLKAARIENGAVEEIRQTVCPLWLGEDRLKQALLNAGEKFLVAPLHAVTMTGELAENFASRAEGVRRILELCAKELRGEIAVYTTRGGFVSPEQAAKLWSEVASANWHATAAAVARLIPDALLIDIGSTTTDIVPIMDGKVAARGFTDAERLAHGELVYTGVIRTSLMALSDRAPFRGAWQPLAAENYATSADLYRLSGELDERDDLYPASDGRGKSAEECLARLARMLGRDTDEARPESWQPAVAYFRERQIRLIHDKALQVISAGALSPAAPVVGAGAGYFLAGEAAKRLGRSYKDFGELVPGLAETQRLARLCAPSVAVALLASPVHSG